MFRRQLHKSNSVSKALEAVCAAQRDAKAGVIRTVEEEKRFTSLVSCRLLTYCLQLVTQGTDWQHYRAALTHKLTIALTQASEATTAVEPGVRWKC